MGFENGKLITSSLELECLSLSREGNLLCKILVFSVGSSLDGVMTLEASGVGFISG